MKVYDIIREDADQKFYAIGDSHAEGIANYGGKNWVSLAVRGTPSTDPAHKSAIAKIPKGSTVAVCLGCNDSANAALRNQNKEKSALAKTPQRVAEDVKSVVDACEAAGLNTIPVLYPPGTDQAKNKAYNLPYAHKCRDAIKAALPGAIDMEGASLYDGVHANGPDYVKVARQVEAKAKTVPKATPKDTGPLGFIKTAYNKVADVLTGTFVIHTPTSNRSPDVADVQKGLVALGFDLPKYGIDGIRGSETSGAIAKFQRANGINPTGKPDEDTVDKLNAMLHAKPELLATLKKSTTAEVKGRSIGGDDNASVGDLLNSDDPAIQEARTVADTYLGRKLTDEEWTALIKVTGAEENTLDGCGHVMAAILNRTRSGRYGNTVVGVVTAKRQFQPVSGVSGNDNHLASLPIRNLKLITRAATQVLPDVDHGIVNFTSNIDAAYQGRDSIRYKYALLNKGGKIHGNSIFATA
jgi:peptidoglycan hydrolase-like protein with peptidoglycan-binding domain